MCPRQVINKHHFLTPDTPILDELELPSHLLRDSTVSGSSHLRSIDGVSPQNDGQHIAIYTEYVIRIRVALACILSRST